MFIFVKMRIF